MKDGAAQEIDEPRPIRILVVVAGCMKPQPCPTACYIALEGAPLLRVSRRLIEPDDELICL